MARRLSAVFILVLCFPAMAQDHMHGEAMPATLMSGLGDLHHPVSTTNTEAQQFFDQGLRLIYAFNHEEAARSFQRAAELDPKLAMAYWGVAEAIGPNYNDPASADRFKMAHQAIRKAVDLSAAASPSDKAYITAMAKRFPADPNADLRKAAEDYHDAMRQVMQQFPDDPDAATLFAESGMDLHPWDLWKQDGTAQPWTPEIVSTLESVIRRYPNHLGAVHYYIHSVEASRTPWRALSAADKLPSLAPAAGHIVHMPAHIYIRTGDYRGAVNTNEKAAAADEAYIKATGAQGMYPMMYYSHNLHFIAVCAGMDGDYARAQDAAQRLAANVGPHLKEVPMLEAFMTIPIEVDVRFHHWDDLLRLTKPDPAMPVTTFFWHFGRGMALAGTGKIAEAEAEYKIVSETESTTPADLIFAPPINNRTKDIYKIAENLLGAKIALARKNSAQAIALLTDAVAVQDTLKYDEPPDWPFPARESLGSVLLMKGDAVAAEKVFREDLDRNPRNPHSLFGLQQALKAQGRDYDAGFVESQFRSSWKGGDTPLKLEDLV
jgi:tetratricopeptide (TPR) repeat protein